MAIMITAASDACVYMLCTRIWRQWRNSFVGMGREPAIEINWLIDLKFIANKMRTKQSKQTIYF